MQPAQNLEGFIDALISEKHQGASLPPENRSKIKADMMNSLNRMITLKMLEQLSPAEMAEFQKLEDNNATDRELQQYIRSHVGPKIQDQNLFLAGILTEFRELYMQ